MAVEPIPPGYHTVTPYLLVKDAARLLDFVKQAFDATETYPAHRMPDGKVMHADVQVGDSKVMLAEAHGEWAPMPAMIYLYVKDCDAVYRQALAAGGTSVREPENQFYGDRSAGVKDPTGNMWFMATHIEDVSPEEMARRTEEATKQMAGN